NTHCRTPSPVPCDTTRAAVDPMPVRRGPVPEPEDCRSVRGTGRTACRTSPPTRCLPPPWRRQYALPACRWFVQRWQLHRSRDQGRATPPTLRYAVSCFLLTERTSEPARFHPECRHPRAAGLNILLVLIEALLCEVESVAQPGRRFERDEVRIRVRCATTAA